MDKSKYRAILQEKLVKGNKRLETRAEVLLFSRKTAKLKPGHQEWVRDNIYPQSSQRTDLNKAKKPWQCLKTDSLRCLFVSFICKD